MAELSPAQAASIIRAVDTEAPVNLWHGSISAGKTISSEIAWLEFCRTGPAAPYFMIGKTLDALERNVVQPLTDMLPAGAVKHTRLSTYATILGRPVYLTGANDNTAENRIRGITLGGAYVDEVTLLPKNFWPMLRTRLRVPGAKLFGTTNPDNPNHWCKTEVVDRATELGFNVFPFTLADNPSLPAAYIEQIKAEHRGLFYRRYILGEWVPAEGAVYSMLDLDGQHRVTWDQVPHLERFILGIDYGTTNPTHAVLLAEGADRRMYVVGEWRWSAREQQQQLTDAQQSKRLTDWLSGGAGIPPEKIASPGDVAKYTRGGRPLPPVAVFPVRVAVDPSAASFRRQLAVDGWTGLTTPSERETVMDGIRAVSSLLGAGRLKFVAGAAPELERELTGYAWDEKAAAKGDDKPLKEADHGPDGLRYGTMAARFIWRAWIVTTQAE